MKSLDTHASQHTSTPKTRRRFSRMSTTIARQNACIPDRHYFLSQSLSTQKKCASPKCLMHACQSRCHTPFYSPNVLSGEAVGPNLVEDYFIDGVSNPLSHSPLFSRHGVCLRGGSGRRLEGTFPLAHDSRPSDGRQCFEVRNSHRRLAATCWQGVCSHKVMFARRAWSIY